MKRLFIATPTVFNSSYRDLISKLRVKLSYDQIVWTDPSVSHLTLRFLGKTPDPVIPLLKEKLREVLSGTSSFSMEMDKIGVFGSRYAPSVLWAGFTEFESYRQLFEKVEKGIVSLGFEPAYGNFVPHITLGRIKKIDNKKRFWELMENNKPDFSQSIPIENLTLFQSRLTPQGPLYTPLEVFSMKK